MSRVTVEKSDLDFATLIYEAVIYWQDFFFGRMLQESWDNAARDMKPRKKSSFNGKSFAGLPKSFSVKDVEQVLGISYKAARSQVSRWQAAGYVKRTKQGMYEKIQDTI